jgi:hypothetical protein
MGNFQWQRIIDTPNQSSARSLCLVDGGNIAFGGSYEIDSPDYDVYLVLLDGIRNAWVSLSPLNPPITIPAQGGSFQFTATLTNCGTISCNPHVWAVVRLPNGQYLNNPVFGPVLIPLNTSQVLSRLRVQNVPASAPAGEYLYKAYTGVQLWHEHTRWDSSSFTFTKLGVGDGGLGIGDWSCTSEEFPPLLRGDRGDLFTTSPNPFNAATVASFELRVPSHVSLKVYDSAGRLVATLVDGFRQAGKHEVTFDGSRLASGMYFVRLEAGEYRAMQKMMLLK